MTEPHFEDGCADYRPRGSVFRPKDAKLTFEADADYQLVKVILIRGEDRKTLCVMDWATAYEFSSALSVHTVSAVTQAEEADRIAEKEFTDD